MLLATLIKTIDFQMGDLLKEVFSNLPGNADYEFDNVEATVLKEDGTS